MNCKYMCQSVLEWILNNKIIVILSLLSFSLFVSTLAIAGQRNRLSSQLDDCRAELPTTVTDASTTLGDSETTNGDATTVTSNQSEVTTGAPNPSDSTSSSDDNDSTTTPASPVRGGGRLGEDSANEDGSNSVRNALQGYGMLTKIIAS